MNKQQLERLNDYLIGYKISKPASGTLSGHAAGEPFEKAIYQSLKETNPKQVFKQFEYLNDLYLKNPTVIGHEARSALFNSPTLLFLLSRGVKATFKANPQELYINWAAAMQIQFHVCDLDQTFTQSRKDWAKQYLQHFVVQAKRRANDMIEKFVKPFENYI